MSEAKKSHYLCRAFDGDEFVVFKNFHCQWCNHRWINRYKVFITEDYCCPLCKNKNFWYFEGEVKRVKVSALIAKKMKGGSGA